ncbi:ABC transporter substrate-binding protein [Labrys wisconsinensis]|uniref:Spermidine/putrescine transport system substrate-binding protein n=1 Tax=Labrys wisconsinensis TaxID=425677 RepID=A0ABU0JJY4_9HYPH|nr:ABC transporter substrate-binding protein [Labrys wisconsinensis]MDQ0474597.1 putative spermidine/putrescine transport system substrate-binding protein [Labrys wisconsinensis]
MRSSIVVASLLALWVAPAFAEGVTLTVNTPGGAVQEGGRAVLWGPAAQKLGFAVKEETADNALDVLRLQAGANAVTTDIIIMSGYQAAIAGKQGLLEPLDYKTIDASGFLPGTAAPYCIGIYGYAAVMAWNTKTYAGQAPSSWADFWDVQKFPGKRAMRADAEAQVEMALLADGVAPKDLYTVLGTEDGMKRAIAKIGALKPHIAIWWSSGAQHGQLMKDGEVDMTTGWNGRFETAKKAGGPVDYTYNQGILTYDCFAVPKGSTHKAEAMTMINAMSAAEAQAGLTRYVSYGPLNQGAYKTGIISKEMEAVLPTSPANSRAMVVQDIDWWAQHNDHVQELFQDMMTE